MHVNKSYERTLYDAWGYVDIYGAGDSQLALWESIKVMRFGWEHILLVCLTHQSPYSTNIRAH